MKFKIQSWIYYARLKTLNWLIKQIPEGNPKEPLRERWRTIGLEWIACINKKCEDIENHYKS